MKSNLIKRIGFYISKRSWVDAFFFVFSSMLQLIRGLMRGYWLVFIGKGVVIRARRRVKIGKFSRIEDYVELDGFGNDGLCIGKFCKIGKFSIVRVPPVPFEKGSGISIGDYSTFAEYSFVGGAAHVTIGIRNAFGQYVSIHPQNHLPKSIDAVVATRSAGIKIGDDNWFGAKSTVLDGTHIGSRSIFAAGTIVRGVFSDCIMAAGVPGKIKRTL